MQIIKDGGGWCSSIYRDGDKVVKKFRREYLSIKASEAEFYRKANGINGIPELLGENEDSIIIPYYPNAQDKFCQLDKQKKIELMKKCADIVYELFMKGICHGDVYEENILFDGQWNCFLIDPLTLNYPRDVPFAQCFDLNAKRPVHPLHDTKPKKPCLELWTGAVFSPFPYVCDKVSRAVIACSGSETYNDMAGKQAYSSYDFPNLFELGGWRNTKQRFDSFVDPSKQAADFGGKTILDVGCNAGAVSVRAAFLGASHVVGFDINSERITVGNKISKFLGMSGVVQLITGSVADATLLSRQGTFDSCFCLAISGRMGDERGFLTGLCKLVRNILYFESNHAPEGYVKYVNLFRELGFPYVEYKGSTTGGFPIRHSLVAKRANK